MDIYEFSGTHINHLIIRYLEGRASDEEILHLRKWLSDSPANLAAFQQYRDLWLEAGATQRYLPDSAWGKIDRRMKAATGSSKKNYHLKWLSYAAAVVCLFLSGYYAFTLVSARSVEEMSGENIRPGSNKAILVLGGDQEVVLNDSSDTSLLMAHKALKQEGNTLIYADDKASLPEDEYNRLITPRGGEYAVILSDGTKVWLNAESELKYPVRFNSGERKVYLKGEAYFSVTKQADKPFVVCSDEAKITVLGTEFNVRNYGDENMATTLVKGSVVVAHGERNSCRLKPGQQAVIGKEGILVQDVETVLYTAWKDGYFIYRETSLEKILKELSRWYDFTYFYQNGGLGDELLTAKIRKFDRADEVFEVLSGTGHFSFITKGKTVTVVAK